MPFKRWNRVAWLGLMLAAATALVSGCGLTAAQRDAVGKFGAAAADLGAVAAEEFRQSRMDVMAMNRARLGLGDKSVHPEALDSYFTLEDVGARVDAAEALEAYGGLLARLAGGEGGPEVEAAAGKLVGSLTRLRAAGRVNISDERLGAIGSAVTGIGGMIVEAQRARAVREATGASGPAVRRLAELIRRDFDPEGEHWSVGYAAAAAKLGEMGADARADLGQAPAGQAGAWIAASRVLADAESMRGENLQRFAEVSRRITASAGALVNAEKDMRGALGNAPVGLDDLDAFTDRVAELVRTYKILRQ